MLTTFFRAFLQLKVPPSNSETINLQRKDFEFDLFTSDDRRDPFWSVQVPKRKGWQRVLDESERVQMRGKWLLLFYCSNEC
jgi:hypothetical protein